MTDSPLPLPKGGFTINWKIPIAAAVSLLVAIFYNAFALGSWKADMERQVTTASQRLDVQRARLDGMGADHDLLQRLDERSAATLNAIAEIKAKLDRIAP